MHQLVFLFQSQDIKKKGKLPNSVIQGRENFEKGESKASDFIKLVHDAFSEDLGPISLTAQEDLYQMDLCSRRISITWTRYVPETQGNANDVTEDLLKLTEQSFFTKKKPNYVKGRPTVVKLDEGDGRIPSVTRKLDSIQDHHIL
ncbi:hypothetical protein ACET3Z_020773 [Daucus carota]